jgi:cobalt/nickel transport system permease protein
LHVHFLDPYQHRHSPIHALDARIKLLLAVAFILTVGLTPVGAWPAYILLLALALVIEMLSELGVIAVLKRSALAAPFMLAALPLMFTIPGAPLAGFSLGDWHFAISAPGLERFASLAFKSWLSVQIAIVLAASTPFPDLLRALRALRLPRLLVAVFGLMWRYLFVLVDEALRLLRARAARSSQSDQPGLKTGGSLAWRAQMAGGMAGNLFLRGFERSDRIYVAMLSRGYDGEVRAFPTPPLRPADWAILSGGLGLLFLLLLFSTLFA